MMESRYEETESILDLGFVESDVPAWKLASRFFHSKVGGFPPWLALEDIPTDLECGLCEQRLIFLLQIYAPIEDNNAAFHRSIYVFFCRNASCHAAEGFDPTKVFRVYRSQLPRANSYYPYDPPVEYPEWRIDLLQEKVLPLCRLCGAFSATKSCSSCKKAKYCSKEHQTIDWKVGDHKSECSNSEISLISTYSSKFLIAEYELVMEADDESVSEDEDSDDDNHEVNVDEEIAKAEALGDKELSPEDLAKAVASDAHDDKIFNKFRKNVKVAPDQVVRYSRGAEPLWISSEGRPSTIPDCPYCGSARKFEFQVMPQLLSSLKLDEGRIGEESVDWGILGVYTCANSCSGGLKYKTEYLFRQNPSSIKK